MRKVKAVEKRPSVPRNAGFLGPPQAGFRKAQLASGHF